MTNVITIDGQDYEFVPEEARFLTEYLFKVQQRLGIPEELTNTDLNEAAWKFIMEIVDVWRTAYPEEHADWISELDIELRYERPVKEAIKKGGYFPISYPARVYQLLKIFLPRLDLQDKKFIKELVRRVPELKHTNYKL